MDRGFLFIKILAMGGFVLVSAVVSGFLSYRAGREVVYREIVDGLSNAGDIVEANLQELTRAELQQLHICGDSLAAEMSDAKRGQLRADLTHIDELDMVILQISVFDKHTTMLATSLMVIRDFKKKECHHETHDLVQVKPSPLRFHEVVVKLFAPNRHYLIRGRQI